MSNLLGFQLLYSNALLRHVYHTLERDLNKNTSLISHKKALEPRRTASREMFFRVHFIFHDFHERFSLEETMLAESLFLCFV